MTSACRSLPLACAVTLMLGLPAAASAAETGPAGSAAIADDPKIAKAAETAVVATAVAKSDFSTSIGLSHSIGSATFVPDEFSDNPTILGSLSLGPSYKVTPVLTAGANFGVGWEYSTPDGPTGRRYAPGDIGVSLGHSSLVNDEAVTGIKVSASFGASLPTSFESRFAHKIVSLSTGPSLSRACFGDKLSLGYGFKFAKPFVSRVNPGYSTDDAEQIRDDRALLMASCRGSGGACTGGPLNTNFSVSNSFNVGWQVTEKLSAGGSFAISNAFKHAVNENPNDAVPDDGRAVGRSDSMSGSVSLGYTIDDTYSAGLALASSPGIDGVEHRLRLPFTDPYLANNSMQLSLDLSARY